MGAELASSFGAARAVFDEIDDALDQKLSELIWNGPEDVLTLTENAQPALMAVSLAAMRVLESEAGVSITENAKFVAGHSLGEYSALAASGALSVADTARLLRTRGQAMQAAVPVGEGAMAALLGAEWDDAKKLAEAAANGEVCATANDNAPGQVVISGSVGAIGRAIEMARDYGARRAVLLPVSAPFHCALMQPAAEAMKEALSDVAIAAPAAPLIANVTAKQVTDPEEIRGLLVEQVTGVVRWRETIGFMVEQGISRVIEIGAGRVLTGLARRIERSLDAISLGTPDDVKAFQEASGTGGS